MPRIIPTEIRPESLEKFKKLYPEKYDFALTDEQAREQGLKLLRLIVVLIENIEIGIDREMNGITDAFEYFLYDRINKKP